VPALARVRPVTLAVWSFCRGRQTLPATLAQVESVTALVEAVGARPAGPGAGPA
jgi:hypothetical protein